MNIVKCRDCQHDVSDSAKICPNCGAPYPYNSDWNGYGYEYKSTRQIFGMPLIHIAFGRNKYDKWRVAKGFIAIGQYGKGVITIAQFGIGVIVISQFGIGIVCISQFGIGLFVIAQMGIVGIWGIGQYIIR
ncbi:membrane protein [Beggiatoa sp. PS]|nr:membrane protein [Beggiatoa sp. PS]